MSSMRMMRYRRWMGKSLWVDRLVIVIWKVVKDIAWIMGWWETLCMRMLMKIIRHLWFVCCWNIIMWGWCNI